MIPANTDVTCPVCDMEFHVNHDVSEDEEVKCEFCDALLILVDGDLEEVDDDIYDDSDNSREK